MQRNKNYFNRKINKTNSKKQTVKFKRENQDENNSVKELILV